MKQWTGWVAIAGEQVQVTVTSLGSDVTLSYRKKVSDVWSVPFLLLQDPLEGLSLEDFSGYIGKTVIHDDGSLPPREGTVNSVVRFGVLVVFNEAVGPVLCLRNNLTLKED
jgi:hypothetical protein